MRDEIICRGVWGHTECGSKIWNTFQTFLVWLVQTLKKKKITEFSGLALLFKHFFIKIQPNMSKQKKKQTKKKETTKNQWFN